MMLNAEKKDWITKFMHVARKAALGTISNHESAERKQDVVSSGYLAMCEIANDSDTDTISPGLLYRMVRCQVLKSILRDKPVKVPGGRIIKRVTLHDAVGNSSSQEDVAVFTESLETCIGLAKKRGCEDVVIEYFGLGGKFMTMKEIGVANGITEARVCQIINRVLLEVAE